MQNAARLLSYQREPFAFRQFPFELQLVFDEMAYIQRSWQLLAQKFEPRHCFAGNCRTVRFHTKVAEELPITPKGKNRFRFSARCQVLDLLRRPRTGLKPG